MKNIPNHVGIIPDGNRRYSKREKTNLLQAYLKGSEIALETVEWARAAGVKHISFFGTSNENVLCRPPSEIVALRKGVFHFCEKILLQNTTLHLVGDIESMGQTPKERKAFRWLKEQSCASGKFVVHADVNYSGDIRFELAPLFEAIKLHGLEKVMLAPERYISSAGVPPIDLVIRLGGKPRLSGFLPFQTTYAELYFRDELWGDFNLEIFDDALKWFAKQDRSKGA